MKIIPALLASILIVAPIAAAQDPPDLDLEKLLAEANRRFERGDFRGAAQALEVILRDDSSDFDLRFRLARAYHEMGDSTGFHRTIRELLAMDPSRIEVTLLMGRRLQKEGSFAEAEDAYRRALVATPGNVEALTGLAEVCLAQGYKEEGLGYLRKVVQLYPDNIPLLWMLARSVGDRKEEASYYARILEASPEGDALALGRLNLLQAGEERSFFEVVGLQKPESVRLFFTPGTTSKAQFVDRDDTGGQAGFRRQATPNTPYIRVRVNGAGPFKMLVDTGTQGIHVSQALAKKLGLRSYGTSRFEGLGVSDMVYGEIVLLDSLKMDDVEVHNIPAETIDLVGIGDGILNPAALRDVRVQLLHSRRQLTLSRQPKPGEEDPLRPRADARRDEPVTERFLSFHGHMVIRVEIQGMVANALLDTGAESTILDLGFVERIPTLQAFDVSGYGVSLEGITGEVLDARVVREAQLVIANKNLQITNLFAADLRRLANFYGPDIHAIIGMRQLRLFDMTFDFEKNEVTFQRILR